ncbi:MAG: histone deacetylase [Planctomycetaceae bacterium]
MTLLYRDDRFLLHQTGSHPECPQRLRGIHARLEHSDLLKRCTQQPVMSAADEDILRVHPEHHLNRIREFADAGGGRIEVDTVMSPESANVAILAAGAAVDAVSRVVSGMDSTALCLVRPPGHHAVPDAPMGFCLLGNAAIAARTAVQRFGLDRVLVVDWDVHHGNGTQDVFYEDEQVGFFSAHRFPFYPGTGRKSETGRGPGLGTTFNLPLKFGISRRDYLSAFENMLTRSADAIKPDLIIVSAGFDAHADDPVGSLGLETEDFSRLTELVLQVADTHSDGRLVSILEGGYNLDRLADCVEVHLETLLNLQKHTG